MNPSENAYWLALLQAGGLKRTVVKQILYRWCIGLEKPAAGLSLAAPGEYELLGLEQAQQDALSAALAGAAAQEAALGKLAAGGIGVLVRSAAAYPELLPLHLDEIHLPYVLFYCGNLELLCLPGLVITGGGQPDSAALEFLHSLAAELAGDECALLNGYRRGIERAAVSSFLSAGGRAVIWLPMGLGAGDALFSELNGYIKTGQLLLLSPVTSDTPYSDAIAAACLPLIAAQGDLLLVLDPDQPPTAWLEKLRPPLPRLAAWPNKADPIAGAWLTQGAVPVSGRGQLLDLWQAARCGEVPAAGQQDAEQPFTYDDTPVAFQDAESAIASLSRSGTVPDSLARRLRECAPKWGK
ncbi:MAG: DNA-processing protein DprA [Anaerolineae bacterium]